MPRPPTTSTHPRVAMVKRSFLDRRSAVLKPLPVVDPAVRVAPWRLRRLGLDPADAAAPVVEEAVRGADTGEDEIASAERVRTPVELGLDLAVEEEVRLLERMVVD